MKRAIYRLMLIPLGALIQACGVDTSLCASFTSELTLLDSAGVARTSFPQGEPVRLSATITNNSSSARTVTIHDGCPEVSGSVEELTGGTLWHSADGLTCTLAVIPTTYQAGESRTFNYDWNQSDRDATPVAQGVYLAQAVQRTECGAELSKSIDFTIE